MDKKKYASPMTDCLETRLEANFMASETVSGSGLDFNEPTSIGVTWEDLF